MSASSNGNPDGASAVSDQNLISDVPQVKYRPMPNSKKKELLTKALLNSAIVIPAAEGL